MVDPRGLIHNSKGLGNQKVFNIIHGAGGSLTPEKASSIAVLNGCQKSEEIRSGCEARQGL